jgi:hypothetical protein
MKKFILFTLIFIPFFLFSQIQWQDNGLPVYCGENVNWTGSTINSSDGNMVMIWSDSRNGDRGIFAQKVTPDGTFLWGETGLEINDDLDTQHCPKATTSLNNEIIIAWVSHYGNFEMEIRVQKIDAFGNGLWQEEGNLLFTGNDVFPYRIQIIDDTCGGAFVVWKNYTLVPDPIIVKGLHVLADGSIDSNWNAGGNILIQNLGLNNFDILPDGFGGFIYAWRSLDNLKIQRIGSNGNPLWGDVGIVLCEETVCNDHIGVVSDNNGLFYFFWKDSRNTNPNMIYMQKVDINGTALFPEDINIYTTTNDLSRIDAIYTTDDNLAIYWTEYDYPQSMIKTLKLDTSGNTLYDPINIFNSVHSCCNLGIISDNNGGYWMKWYFFSNAEELYVQHIDESGAITLNNNGLFICEAIQSISIFTINLTSDNRAFLSWSDESTGNNSLYVQVVDEVGNLQFPEDGLNIYEGLSGYSYDLEVFPNEDNPIFIWINDSGGSRIFAQSLNSDGSPVFDENGIPITPLFSNSQENFAANIPLGSNEIAIVWEMNEEGYKQIYSQAVDFNGNYLWSNNYGLIVGQSSAQQEIPKISSINNSGTYEYYIGWHDFTDYMDSQIKGQKIINGNLQWGEAGVVITDREGDDNLQDIVGKCYIWQNETIGDYNIYAKLVDENGNTAPGWDENGTAICEADGIQNLPAGLQIPQGYLIIWQDHRDSEHDDIYGQIITEEGNILWQQDGLPLVAQLSYQGYFNFQFDDYFYLVWQDYRSGVCSEIYAQKFDENGNELWQTGGVLIGEGAKPDIVKIGDSLVIVWENPEEYDFSDIHAQLIDLDGNLLWDPDGIVLCDASWDQRNPQIVRNESNDVYIGWLDKLHQNYPNPFNPETKIFFYLPEAVRVKLEIFNIKGQKVKTLLDCHMNQGSSEMIWNGTDENDQSLSSGVYFYRLKADTFEKSKKMILLK